MEIIYLGSLQNNPIKYGISRDFINMSISQEAINQLQQLYNRGNQFPKALEELLYLAGKRCYGLDYGLNETQQELQEFVRESMAEENRVITRPFYAIDVYNVGDQFLFVYLDEGENLAVHEGHYWDSSERPHGITLVNPSLSSYIDNLVERVKNGRNPF